MKDDPKVLVISHNVFSKTNAMGRTLADMLSCLPAENLAQLYFHSEIPTVRCCENYFRVTDRDMLRSVFPRKARYRIFRKEDIQTGVANPRTDTGAAAKVYQYSRKRTPLIYLMRNALWKLGKWKSQALFDWAADFHPDLIFYAAGDYSFSYRVACALADRLRIPVVLYCADDFYLSERHGRSPLAAHYRKDLMKRLDSVKRRCTDVIVISDKMRQDYASLFSCRLHTLRISADENPFALPFEQRKGIIYAGALGVGRIEPLLALSKALQKADLPDYPMLDVYSGDRNETTLALLTEENGVRFHGAATPDEVKKHIGEARFVLHVESFREEYKARTRYSLSTKIADCLRCGGCILAYGPADISSIEYLSDHKAAYTLRTPQEIAEAVTALSQNKTLFLDYAERAETLAKACHDREKNHADMRAILRTAADLSAKGER